MDPHRHRRCACLAGVAATLLASALTAQQVRYYVSSSVADATVMARAHRALLEIEPDLKIETVDTWLLLVTAPAPIDWSQALPEASRRADVALYALHADSPETNFDALPRPTDEPEADDADRRRSHWRHAVRMAGNERTELRMLLRCRALLRADGRRDDPRLVAVARFDAALGRLWRDRLGKVEFDNLLATGKQDADAIEALDSWSKRDEIQSSQRMPSGFTDRTGLELLRRERLADYQLASALGWRTIAAQLTTLAAACDTDNGDGDEQLATECLIIAREADLLSRGHWETDAIAAANTAKLRARRTKPAR